MKRLLATIGVALLLTTALALPAAAARTTQFSTLEACYTDLGEGFYEWTGSFEIKTGPLPDVVYMTVGSGSAAFADSDYPNLAERNRLYTGTAVWEASRGTQVEVNSQFGVPGAPNFSFDEQTFDAFPC